MMNEKIIKITDDIILIFHSLSSIINNDENLKLKEEWLNTLQGFKDELEPYTEIIGDNENTFSVIIKNLYNKSNEDRNKLTEK